MNRADLQRLTYERVLDAQALLDGQRWEFAYYSIGYAVECALKACILSRMILTGWVFEEKWKAQECMTHDVAELVRLAGLQPELDQIQPNPAFRENWKVVTAWTVTSRYVPKTENDAKLLFEAVTGNPDGVLPWIKNFW